MSSIESDRVVKLENVHNFRDMGGYATTSGKKVKRGLLFRSADPSGASECDTDAIVTQKNITTWLDLRSPKEQKKSKIYSSYSTTAITDSSDATKVVEDRSGPRHRYVIDFNANLKRDMMRVIWQNSTWIEFLFFFLAVIFCQKKLQYKLLTAVLTKIKLAGLYSVMIDYCPKQISTALKLAAESEGSVLVNCMLGKDRTGTLSALILLALGVDEETVVEDYHLTEAHLDFSIRQKAILVAGADPNIFAAAPKEEMRRLIQLMKSKYGSVDMYFDLIGFHEKWRMQLQNKYLE